MIHKTYALSSNADKTWAFLELLEQHGACCVSVSRRGIHAVWHNEEQEKAFHISLTENFNAERENNPCLKGGT